MAPLQDMAKTNRLSNYETLSVRLLRLQLIRLAFPNVTGCAKCRWSRGGCAKCRLPAAYAAPAADAAPAAHTAGAGENGGPAGQKQEPPAKRAKGK